MKCKWYDKGCSGAGFKGQLKPKLKRGCAKYTDERCNIIKPKDKDHVIRAWVNVGTDKSIIGVHWYKENCYCTSVPCTIHISASQWKKIKGGK